MSAHVTGFFKRVFAFQHFTTARTEWKDKVAEVDVLEILEHRKLNHEERDYVTTILRRVSERVRRNSYDQRVLAGIAASLNARAFAEHLDRETEGCKMVRAGRLLKIALLYKGKCFTDSFDCRTYYKSEAEQEEVKHVRLLRVSRLENDRDVSLRGAGVVWRMKTCIENRLAYGSLLGKNAVAYLTMFVKPDGTRRGCLPGPGAMSGLRFWQGKSLGIGCCSTTAGVLAEQYEDAINDYEWVRGEWKALQKEYASLAQNTHLSVEEQAFWSALASRLNQWASHKTDDLRTQFRLCEASKIGNIICRNQGRFRRPQAGSAQGEQEVRGEEEEDRDVVDVEHDVPEAHGGDARRALEAFIANCEVGREFGAAGPSQRKRKVEAAER